MADFDIAAIDDVIHGRVRLGIVAYLANAEVADFNELKAALDKAAMGCVRSWKFKPALLSDDTPIGQTIVVHQPFTAND